MFYLSALSFAIANAIYQARCPRLIKEYSTYSDFDTEGKPEWHLKDYTENIGKEFTQSLFWHIFRDADHKRKATLLGCIGFYIVGFVLIGYVFIQNFYWVMKSILG